MSKYALEAISEDEDASAAVGIKVTNEKLKITYSSLNSWQKTMVARHENRPRANFYIK